jgi:hypothetical protein
MFHGNAMYRTRNIAEVHSRFDEDTGYIYVQAFPYLNNTLS